MRVFFAALATETNTFSSIPTGKAAFAFGSKHGPEVFDDRGFFGPCARTLRDLVAVDGGVIIPSFFGFAQPAGPTVQTVYEELRDTILTDLKAAGPVDIVILLLHGAMVAQQTWDCEGDILDRVRSIVGPDVPVGAVLDPHAHLTERMIDNATVLSFMKEYPHTDGLDRLSDVWFLCRRVRMGEIEPVAAVHDCCMIAFWPTAPQPMRGFVDRMMALEGRDEVLSVSFVHGFPWGDTPVTGAKMLVYTNADSDKAAILAHDLGEELWCMRDQTRMPLVTLEQAIERMAGNSQGLLVLADMADNAGAGAPADSTFVLRAALNSGLSEIGFALFNDPQAVNTCHEAGLGARLALRIGGKLGPESGDPVDLEVEIMGLHQQGSQRMFGGDAISALGRTAWVRGAGLDLVLASERTQCYDPTAFTHLGLKLADLRAVVVKSTNHFRAGFDALASETLFIDGPGAVPPGFASIPFKVFDKPFWPRVADPTKTSQAH